MALTNYLLQAAIIVPVCLGLGLFDRVTPSLGVLLALGVLETSAHRRRLAKIPIRIHVNGTRGKSSVTRLIAAGLRESGLVTCAKTTGTLPRMILPSGLEYPVFRPSHANVIEQIRIVRTAVSYEAEAENINSENIVAGILEGLPVP